MKAIIVDDEPIFIKSFLRQTEGIVDLNVVGSFESGEEALEYAKNNPIEIAFLDIAMPEMNGIQCAEKLREIYPDLMIVFISAYDEYVRDFNRIGADYYIIKPYNHETLKMMMNKMRLLKKRQKKSIFIQTFGRFVVKQDDKPIMLTGKAKEILALAVVKHGKEVSNEELYSTIWENRAYDNISMKVYYNALHRLKVTLKDQGLADLLISTSRGQIVNIDIFDCDYYEWLDNKRDFNDFEGEFLPEYPWGEYILGNIMSSYFKDENK